MNDDYKTITTGLGAELRDLMHGAIRNRAQDVIGREELRSELARILPDTDHTDYAPVRAALAKKFVEYAERGRAREGRFELQGRIDRFVLDTVQTLEADDRLVADDEDDEIDVDAAVDVATGKGTISDTSDLFDGYEETVDGKGGRVLVRRERS